jgi:cation transport ATPase
MWGEEPPSTSPFLSRAAGFLLECVVTRNKMPQISKVWTAVIGEVSSRFYRSPPSMRRIRQWFIFILLIVLSPCNHVLMNSEKESIIKKKSNLRWKVIFVFLLIVNLIFVTWILDHINFGGYMWEVTFVVVYPFLLTLVIIDIIAVFSYIKKQYPQGIAKVISYTTLILIGTVLIYVISPVVFSIFFSIGIIH